MKRSTYLWLIAILTSFTASAARADSIPYAKAGTVAPEVSVFATSYGITVYYYGSTAGYTDYVGVYDLQTGYDSGKVLNNKTTSVGASLTLGAGAGEINPGDQLLFYITGQGGTFYSAGARNSDGINHAYITTYSGGTANNVKIPAGLFVGLEDKSKSTSDLNYNDDTFVFTGVTSPVAVTPEPPAPVLLLSGIFGIMTALNLHRSRI